MPDRPAVVTPEEALGFSELHDRALRLATYLRELGIARGDIVAAQLPNGLEFILTYLAAGCLGATLQTVHMPYRAAEIAPLLAHSGAKALVCTTGQKDFSPAAFALAAKDGLPSLDHVMAVGPEPPSGALPFSAFEAATPDPELERPSAADRLLLLYTSGTTSAPKGVPVPHPHFLRNAEGAATELGIDHSSVLLSAAPFTHLYGLFSLNVAFASGATTAVLPAYTPGALAEALDRYRPTGLFSAPAHMAACLAAGLLTRERLASLHFLQISGSACPPELARSVQDLMPNGEVQQLWGMTELQAGAFTRPGDPAGLRFGTAGRASPGTELRVVPENGIAPPGSDGELQVRGRSVFDGYLDNPDATAAAFTQDGWFRTGDLAVMDEGGNVRITGRSKDVINRGGVKFNPADIEALIAQHPAVAACAIVPMPDAVLGERACCFLVPAAGAPGLKLDELCAWLGQHQVAKLKWPERLEIVDEMPLTPTRKVMKGELARRAARLA